MTIRWCRWWCALHHPNQRRSTPLCWRLPRADRHPQNQQLQNNPSRALSHVPLSLPIAGSPPRKGAGKPRGSLVALFHARAQTDMANAIGLGRRVQVAVDANLCQVGTQRGQRHPLWVRPQ